MDRNYDVIVAGGGIAGMLAATSLAIHSHQKFRIAILDRNPPEMAGKKTATGWICGDAVSNNKLSYVSKHLGITYGPPEVEHNVEGVLVYSPDHKVPVMFEGNGHLLDRRIFPQRQLRDAAKVGVEYVGGVNIVGAIAEDGFVAGVKGFRSAGGRAEPFKATSRLVIDATGMASPIRSELPVRSYIQEKIDRDDIEPTGRYILEFESGAEDETFFDPDVCIIHLDQKLAPGGYAWVFPKGRTKVNIGLGVQKKRLDQRNVATGRNETLKDLIDGYVRINPVIRNWKVVQDGNGYGTWQVSVRRQNDALVANGLMLVGDAAWMPRAIDAGGIGPTLVSGVLSGRYAAQGLESGDTGQESLWAYAKAYFDEYGYKMASYEILRRVLQTFTNEQINFGMKHILSRLDVEELSGGDAPEFAASSKLSTLFHAIFSSRISENFRTVNGILFYKRKNDILLELNRNYPENPSRFPEWHKGLMKEMDEVRQLYD